MKNYFPAVSGFLLVCCILLSGCSYKVYVVRHAEKSVSPANNPLLTDAGSARAIKLKETLQGKKITRIYSTNTTRTLNTAEPLADYLKIKTEIYKPVPDSNFISILRSNRSNQLVVGHSNTIDDIVNMLCGKKVIPADVSEAVYDNLFVIKLSKSGKKAVFVGRRF